MSYLIYASSILYSIKGYFTSSDDLSSISMLDTKCGQNLQNWLSQLTLSQQWFSDIFIDSNPFIYNMCTEVSFHICLNVFLPKMVFLLLPVPGNCLRCCQNKMKLNTTSTKKSVNGIQLLAISVKKRKKKFSLTFNFSINN